MFVIGKNPTFLKLQKIPPAYTTVVRYNDDFHAA